MALREMRLHRRAYSRINLAFEMLREEGSAPDRRGVARRRSQDGFFAAGTRLSESFGRSAGSYQAWLLRSHACWYGPRRRLRIRVEEHALRRGGPSAEG